MLWKGRRESSNVEDRRAMSGGGKVAIGGGVIGIVIVVLNLLMGGDVDLSQITQQMQPSASTSRQLSPEEQALDDERAQFVKVVLADTEDVWTKLMKEQGKEYLEPTLVLFRDQVQSACGMAGSASGPFYCPGDQKVYIDLSFYEDMQNQLHAPGDFAMAYVIAHEIGHHIQYLNGLSAKMERLRRQVSEEEYNKYSVMLELQADFYAGVWAHHAQRMKNMLEDNDLEEALNAANAIGDDRLQQQSQGHVVPESFTHGTSAQRVHWFKKGFETGDISQGNTFDQ